MKGFIIMLFLELINKTSPDEVKYSLLLSYPLLYPQLKDPEERILNALLGLWEELQELLCPALIDRKKTPWLMSWLHDALPSPLAFDKESENGILHLGNNSYPDGPEGIIADYIAREIQSILSFKGIDSIKRCPHCLKYYLGDFCCTVLDSSLYKQLQNVYTPETIAKLAKSLKCQKTSDFIKQLLKDNRLCPN